MLLVTVLILTTAIVEVHSVPARRGLGGTHLEMRPVHFKPCAGVDNNAFTQVDVDFQYHGRTSIVMSVNCSISRSVEQWPKAKIVIEKCDGAVSSSTCAPFRNFEFNDVCASMMNPVMPWSKIVSGAKPSLGCPIKKGEYRLDKSTLSMELLNAASATIRLEGPVWRTRFFVLDGAGDVHLCGDLAGEFFRVRSRPPG